MDQSTKDKLIISGAEDGTIKVWDLKTGKQLQTLTGGHGSITCMKIVGEKLIFGAEDGTIKIWDFTAGKQLQDLVGGQGSTTCLKILDKFIVSGSSKGAINNLGSPYWKTASGVPWESKLDFRHENRRRKFFSSRINGALRSGILYLDQPKSVNRVFMNPISSYNPSIAALPREILELTCNYLNDAKDLIHFASAHKKFHFLASTDPLSAPLWNLLLRKDFPTSYTRLKTEAASLDFYKALARIEHNMKNGKQRLQTLSHEYDPTLYDILTFYLAIWKDKLISFPCWSPPQCDCTVKVWNLKTVIAEKHLLLVESYDSLIKCTRIVKDKLILGLCAGEIKIWDLNHVEKSYDTERASRRDPMH